MVPLISAIAAGNTCVVKLSELTPATSMAIAMHLNEYISKDLVGIVLGGPKTAGILLKEKFDHIFFTGSERVGKIVMKAAAEHLTPGIRSALTIGYFLNIHSDLGAWR